MKKTEILVKERGELLDYLLSNTEISRNKIKSVLKYNGILVNGKVVSQFNYPVKAKDKIIIQTEGKKIKSPVPIIFEDDNYLVVNKKAGLLTVSTEKEKEKTLYHMMREYLKENNSKENLFIVHRLDKDTSGIVIFVKNERLKFELQNDWNNLALKRNYVAIVEGILEEKQGKITSYLVEPETSNMVYVTKDRKEGKIAITEYKVLKESKKYSMLNINLKTGRKNQIRVQFNDIGHKVVGDKKYGVMTKEKRMFLIANEVEIMDPITKQKLHFIIKVPNEFKEFIR